MITKIVLGVGWIVFSSVIIATVFQANAQCAEYYVALCGACLVAGGLGMMRERD